MFSQILFPNPVVDSSSNPPLFGILKLIFANADPKCQQILLNLLKQIYEKGENYQTSVYNLVKNFEDQFPIECSQSLLRDFAKQIQNS